MLLLALRTNKDMEMWGKFPDDLMGIEETMEKLFLDIRWAWERIFEPWNPILGWQISYLNYTAISDN